MNGPPEPVRWQIRLFHKESDMESGYCPECGEYEEECTCRETLEEYLTDPDTTPELNFDAGY